MAREYFCAYHSYLKAIETLTDAERGRLFVALLEYSMTGVAQGLSGSERHVFPLMREQIDRDKNKYEDKCRKNRENGAKGGERKRLLPVRGRSVANAPQGKGKDKDKSKKEKDAKASKKKFVPPTLDEIAAYCQKRKNNVDPRRFFDYFTSDEDPAKHWIDSEGKPVRNWKQKIITWEGNRHGSNQRNAPELPAGNTGETKPKYGNVL